MMIFHHLEWKKKETNFPLLSHSNIKFKKFESSINFWSNPFLSIVHLIRIENWGSDGIVYSICWELVRSRVEFYSI